MLSPKKMILICCCGVIAGCAAPQWIDGRPPILTDHSTQSNPRHRATKSKVLVAHATNDEVKQRARENEQKNASSTPADSAKKQDKKSTSVDPPKKSTATKPASNEEAESTPRPTKDTQPNSAADPSAPDSADDAQKNPPKVSGITLAEVYDELEAVRDIDPELHRKLQNDLKQTDPAFWPLLVKNIRAALIIREGNRESLEDTTKEVTIAKRMTADEVFRQPRNTLRDQQNSATDGPSNRRERTVNPVRPTDAESTRFSAEDSDRRSSAVTVRDSADSSRTDSEGTSRNDDPHDGWVEKASYETEVPFQEGSWRQQLRLAIEALEVDLQETDGLAKSDTRSYESSQAMLRLLYLASGRGDDAVAKIPELEDDRQEFWSKLFFALKSYLDTSGSPVTDRRAERAVRDLREAMGNLANVSRLHVHNLAFCGNVDSFGQYTTLEPYAFQPDQEVLLYAEIDNFAAERMPNGGYKTEMEGSYQILDRSGQRVADRTFAAEKEICRNRRRDYFIPFRMWMPKELYPGEYTLQLTIEDKIGNKFGQASIGFEMKR